MDSGSGVPLIKPGICRSEARPSSTISVGETGDAVDITREQDVPFCLNGWYYRHTVFVFFPPHGCRRNIRDAFSVGNERLIEYWKAND